MYLFIFSIFHFRYEVFEELSSGIDFNVYFKNIKRDDGIDEWIDKENKKK